MPYPKKKKPELRADSNDYLADMAAIIDILMQDSQQAAKAIIESQKDHTKRLRNIENKLMLLQKLCEIIKNQ